MQIKKLALNSLLVLCSLFISIGAVDLSLGYLSKAQADQQKKKCSRLDAQAFADSRGFSLERAFYKPNSIINHCSTEFDYDYHIDENGFRKHNNYKKDPTVFAVGDSFTFGFGVTDEEAFPALLGAYNSGMWGNPFDIQIRAFERGVALLHPKKVIWGIYPPHIISMTKSSWNTTCPGDSSLHFGNGPFTALLNNLLSSALPKSAIWQMILKAKSIVKISVEDGELRVSKNCYDTKEAIIFDRNIGATDYTGNRVYNETLKTELDGVYADMTSYFKQAKKIADKERIQITFLYIPSRLYLNVNQGNTSLFKPYTNASFDPNLPKTTVVKILKDSGFAESDILDLGETFLHLPNWKEKYFTIDAHWNAEGHKVVAEAIEKFANLSKK